MMIYMLIKANNISLYLSYHHFYGLGYPCLIKFRQFQERIKLINIHTDITTVLSNYIIPAQVAHPPGVWKVIGSILGPNCVISKEDVKSCTYAAMSDARY